ncbi:AbrB/MazE/SpoVT family DNA-binding domain-containing protein [Sandaracinobacteroides saxicola]|uniref:AbrB/MazE/SpoVT family DNA-binding domain-containing protein n=1 Tax=Sandaracinobacteroides saxicola TaxID=2759707 RepID=A0A7G5IJF3_9SPHN|nr:AbrB/MazE/SpoVT family DNA-binding domain-containing protein [Sandaracinobacteroides saxicola]QMW23495.1 AbrB/MazE/SpoVT family DNA-binding domain-containing protein [Sandaracinobacteroides saxicola]
MPRTTRIFKSGNSMAVRLPADYPVTVGQQVSVREEMGRFIVEPVRQKIDLTGIAGAIPWLKPLTPEERMFEERELDWDMKYAGKPRD